MFGFGKSMDDNARDFGKEYDFVQLTSVAYVKAWFDQIFETPPYNELYKDNPELSQSLAFEVVKYLSGQDLDKDTPKEKNETYHLARKHAEKWADDVMKMDKDFCELRVQTLRLDLIFKSYQQGTDFYKTEAGKRIMDILQKYGKLIPEEPSPKKYTKLIKTKWVPWYEYAKSKSLV